jgi:hypothetical protein
LGAEQKFREITSSEKSLLKTKCLVPLLVIERGPLAGINVKPKANVRVLLYSGSKWIFKDYWDVEEGERIGSLIMEAGKELDFRMGLLQSPKIVKTPSRAIKGHSDKSYLFEVIYSNATVEKYDSRLEINRLKGS